ncbi:MAG: hypothetical protein [Cotesia congregata filamentous virus 2]
MEMLKRNQTTPMLLSSSSASLSISSPVKKVNIDFYVKERDKKNIEYNPFLLIQALGVDVYPNIVKHISDVYTFNNFCLAIAAIEDKITAKTIVRFFYQSKIIKSSSNETLNRFLYDKYLLFTAYLQYQDYLDDSLNINMNIAENGQRVSVIKSVIGHKCDCTKITDFYIFFNTIQIVFFYCGHNQLLFVFNLVKKFMFSNKRALRDIVFLFNLLKMANESVITRIAIIDIVQISQKYYVLIIIDFCNRNAYMFNLYTDGIDNLIFVKCHHFYLNFIKLIQNDIYGLDFNSEFITMFINDEKLIKIEYRLSPNFVIHDNSNNSEFLNFKINHKGDNPKVIYSSSIRNYPSITLKYNKWIYLLKMCLGKSNVFTKCENPSMYLLGIFNNIAYYIIHSGRVIQNDLLAIHLNKLRYSEVDALLDQKQLSFNSLWY